MCSLTCRPPSPCAASRAAPHVAGTETFMQVRRSLKLSGPDDDYAKAFRSVAELMSSFSHQAGHRELTESYGRHGAMAGCTGRDEGVTS